MKKMGLFSRGKKEEKPEEEFDYVPEQFIIPDSEIPDGYKLEFVDKVEKFGKWYDENWNDDEEPQLAYWNIIEEKPALASVPWRFPYRFDVTEEIEKTGLKPEETIWCRINHDGVVNRKLKNFEVVTNYRIYFMDCTQDEFRDGVKVLTSYYLANADVVVNNSKRVSNSTRTGSYAGVGLRGIRSGTYGGTSNSQSQTIGDVSIMNEGIEEYTFYGVLDPQGLKNILKSIFKNQSQFRKKCDKYIDLATGGVSSNDVPCPKCNSGNPKNSKFCNDCGEKLQLECPSCNKVNPLGSKFCNECGEKLE